jgi:hypothetical protein
VHFARRAEATQHPLCGAVDVLFCVQPERDTQAQHFAKRNVSRVVLKSSACLGGVNPSLADAFILKLRLVLRIVQRLMPSVSKNLPVLIATEQVKRLLALMETNHQAGHCAHRPAGNYLLARTCESVALINRRVANQSLVSADLWP